MPSSDRIVHIFVSSTLPDLTGEHRVLHTEVFPKLRDLCRRHGCTLHVIDLPWDSGTCTARNSLRLRVDEITRLLRCSPPPIFVCLLGDRYGRQPLPEFLPAAEFEQASRGIPTENTALLHEWYRLDSNALPPVYALQPRSGVFAQPAVWERFVEAPLRSFLLGVIRGFDLGPNGLLKYTTSVLEQEIQVGVFDGMEAGGRALCFSRSVQGLPPDARAAAFADTDASGKQDGGARIRLEALKMRLRDHLGRSYFHYDAPWRDGAVSSAHLETLAADAHSALARIVKEQIKHLETAARAGAESEAHRAFASEQARFFTGRARPLERITEYLRGADPHPLVVTGPPGSGKSALLAHAFERHLAAGGAGTCIYRSVGVTLEASDGRALLEDVCRHLSADSLEAAGYRELIEQFPARLKAATGPAVVILDALDELPVNDQAADLHWLPPLLPERTRIIVSAAPGGLLERLRRMVPAGNIIELEPMSAGEAGQLLEQWLGAAGRTLTESQRARVLEAFGACPLPLYLKLVCEEAMLWRSNTLVDDGSFAADVSGQIHRVFERLATPALHGALAAPRCLGYLAVSRYGLEEDELLDVLSTDGEVPPFAWPGLCLDVRPYITRRTFAGTALLCFKHRQFAEAVTRLYWPAGQARDRHQALARYFEKNGGPERRFCELVWQQAHGGMWTELEATLASLEFVQAAARAGFVHLLAGDCRTARECWSAEKQGPPPWRDWDSFITSQAGLIGALAGEYPQIVFQQAFNQARRGRVPQAAQALLRDGQGPRRSWFERVNRPENAARQRCALILEGHRGPVSPLILSPEGEFILSGADDGRVRAWSVSTSACVRVFEGHTSGVMALCTAGDGRVVSASWDGTVRVWNLYTGECLYVLEGHGSPVAALASVSPGRVVSGAFDGTLRLWDIASGACLAVLEGHKDRINHILPLRGERIASASDDSTVRLWHLDGSEAGVLGGHGGPVLHLSHIPGALCASCRSGKIMLWDVETGRLRDTLVGHSGPVNGTVLLDSARLLSWACDNSIRIWSLVDASQLADLRGHTAPVTGVEVLKDGRLVSCSADSTMRVWDSAGEPLGVLRGHRSWINAAASFGESLVVSAGRDGTVRIWDLRDTAGEPPDAPADLAAEAFRSHGFSGVYVVDPAAAILVTREPELLQLWDLVEGRCVQSATSRSESGTQLLERIRPLIGQNGPSFCGKPRSGWGLTIAGIRRREGEPAYALGLTHEHKAAPAGHDSRPQALYPLVCDPFSWTFECDRAIAFDAGTREAHVVTVHRGEALADQSEAAERSGGGLRSLFGKLLKRGERK